MSVSESARHQMFNRFEEVVGAVTTETLMGLLPPVGWADVVTKQDLAQMEARLDTRFDAIDLKIASAIDRAIAGQMRLFVGTTVTLMLGLMGTVVALS